MNLWLNSAGALIWNGTQALQCAECPCPGQHITPCNGVVGVPAKLIMTLSYNAGSTLEVPVRYTRNTSTTPCSNGEAWTYLQGGALNDLVLCVDLGTPNNSRYFRDVTLCCGLDDAGIWAMEIVYTRDGGIQDVTTIGTGIDPIVIVSDGSVTPLHYTTTIPGGFGGCSNTDVLVDIQAAP